MQRRLVIRHRQSIFYIVLLQHLLLQSWSFTKNNASVVVVATTTTTTTTLFDLAKRSVREIEEQFGHLKKTEEEEEDGHNTNDQSAAIAKMFFNQVVVSSSSSDDKKSWKTAVAGSKLYDSDDEDGYDRLVKAGRSIVDLLSWANDDDDGDDDDGFMMGISDRERVESGLELLVEEYKLLNGSNLKIPKTRFGRTNISLSLLTLGGMRLQQTWSSQSITHPSQLAATCQRNLRRILHYALVTLGINHVETARMYGCSELQLGVALEGMFNGGEVKREDVVLQTKVSPRESAEEFRLALEESFRLLRVDYIDLFSFHGVNVERSFDYIFDNGEESNMDVVRKYVARGRIRHVGFSSHGSVELIKKMIMTNEFSYGNIHYHFIGSYTATGQGSNGMGNRDNVRLMKEKDMGVFIISPYDKGGMLYAPSRKLRSLTLPEMEPMAFGSLWLWQHHLRDGEDEQQQGGDGAIVHTIVCGAARPSDLDQPALAALKHAQNPTHTHNQILTIQKRLDRAMTQTLGRDWVATWHVGLPTWQTSHYGIHFTHLVGIYNLARGYGLVDYARARYRSMEANEAEWDDENKSLRENIERAIDLDEWPWTPGRSVRVIGDDVDDYYRKDWKDCPKENVERLKEVVRYVREVLASKDDDDEEEEEEEEEDCKISYDMRPWTAFPERSEDDDDNNEDYYNYYHYDHAQNGGGGSGGGGGGGGAKKTKRDFVSQNDDYSNVLFFGLVSCIIVVFEVLLFLCVPAASGTTTTGSNLNNIYKQQRRQGRFALLSHPLRLRLILYFILLISFFSIRGFYFYL